MKKDVRKSEPRATRDTQAMMRLFTFGLGAVYCKSPDTLAHPDLHRLNALRLYYAYRHNGYILAEALDLCTRNKVNPPAWVLEGINESLQRFIGGNVTLTRALSLGKREHEEYRQYREEHPVMGEIRELINKDPGRKIAPACIRVAARRGLNHDTLEKAYRRFWRGFFDYVSNPNPGP